MHPLATLPWLYRYMSIQFILVYNGVEGFSATLFCTILLRMCFSMASLSVLAHLGFVSLVCYHTIWDQANCVAFFPVSSAGRYRLILLFGPQPGDQLKHELLLHCRFAVANPQSSAEDLHYFPSDWKMGGCRKHLRLVLFGVYQPLLFICTWAILFP